ncbi:MAG TPA: ACT domain-containing protein [Bacteroidales bacterium]|nr:ACT domain-containing protein [Bacteroidales bacterium]
MKSMLLSLRVHKDPYAVIRFKPDAEVPDWLGDSPFFSVTRTKNELSVVCRQPDSDLIESAINKDWRIIEAEGPLDFSLSGIIADISGIFKKFQISTFTVSTYDTDYFLVGNKDLDKSIECLRAAGHTVTFEK